MLAFSSDLYPYLKYRTPIDIAFEDSFCIEVVLHTSTLWRYPFIYNSRAQLLEFEEYSFTHLLYENGKHLPTLQLSI